MKFENAGSPETEHVWFLVGRGTLDLYSPTDTYSVVMDVPTGRREQ